MRVRLPVMAVLLPLSASCSNQGYQEAVPPLYELGETSTVTGSLTYRERIALPLGSTATVTLSDTAKADAPATVISEQRYSLDGVSVPFGFSLDRPNKLDQKVSLTLRATITDANGRLLFTTDTVTPVMSRPVDQDLGEIVMVSAR